MKNVVLKVGDVYRCPERHEAKIVWMSEDKKTIGVKCPQNHFTKMVKGKKIYDRNYIFLIKV